MNILVTGGAGYVGSHAAKLLREARGTRSGFSTTGLRPPGRGAVGRLDRGRPARSAEGRGVLREQIDAVMHFAAFAYVGESVTDPAKYYRNNVIGTLSLMEAMRAAGVWRIVFSSTCATYGVPERCRSARACRRSRSTLMGSRSW